MQPKIQEGFEDPTDWHNIVINANWKNFIVGT